MKFSQKLKIKLTKKLPTEEGSYFWAESLGSTIHMANVTRDKYTGYMNAEIGGFKFSAIHHSGYWAKVEKDHFEFEGE